MIEHLLNPFTEPGAVLAGAAAVSYTCFQLQRWVEKRSRTFGVAVGVVAVLAALVLAGGCVALVVLTPDSCDGQPNEDECRRDASYEGPFRNR